MTTLITRLITISPITWLGFTFSRYTTTSRPPISANTAPDAPASGPST